LDGRSLGSAIKANPGVRRRKCYDKVTPEFSVRFGRQLVTDRQVPAQQAFSEEKESPPASVPAG
jgi:hypothetical protein